MSNAFIVPDGISWTCSDCNIHTFNIDSNGMRVVWAPVMQGTKCTVHRIITSGSQCENYSNLGGTHALEHFMFKDGAAWKRFTRYGAMMNAYTDTKNLATTADLPVDQLFNWLEYQAECMRGEHLANLSVHQIESEISNVIDEMNRNRGAPFASRKVLLALQRHCLPQGNATPTIGLETTLHDIKDASAIVAMQNALLGPSRNTLLIVGQCNPNDLMKSIYDNFSGIPKNPNIAPLPNPIAPDGKGLTMIDIREKAGATILGLGWPCPAYCRDVDVLKTIVGILTPPGESESPMTPYKAAGIVYECGAFVPYSETPDVFSMLVTVPCSAQNEQVTVAKAQMCMVQLLAGVLPKFDRQDLLDNALERIRLGYSYSTNGDSSAVASAVSEGIKSGNPSLHWHANKRFAPGAITLDDIQRVSRELLGPSNMCLVRYLQNEIPTASEFNISPPAQLHDTTGTLTIDTSMADAFSNENFKPVSFGVLHTRNIAPTNRATCMYAFPGVGRVHNWGESALLCKLLNDHGDGRDELVKLNYSMNWKPHHKEVVVTLNGPAEHMQDALKIMHTKCKLSTFAEDKVNLVKMQTAAIINGHQFDAGLASKIKYTNKIYPAEDPCYITPLEERLRSTTSATQASIDACAMLVREGKPLMAGINMSPEDIKMACSECSVLPALTQYKAVSNYTPVLHKTTITNTPSCKVVIAQPCSNVQCTHYKDLADMRVACNVMGNGFGGRLMKVIRDEMGYTYGISCQMSNTASTPSVVVGATFNADVIDDAIKATLQMLKDWSTHGITQEEFDVSKDSLLNKIQLHGLGQQYVKGRLLRAITSHVGHDESAVWNHIAETTLDDVNALLRTHVKPDGFTISIAGSV